jgi:hypothetical protein
VTPTCALCGRGLLESGEGIYVRVIGWERPGKGSTGNTGSSIVLREKLDEYAHSTCIQKKRAGVTPTQPSLLDDDA